MLDMKPSTVNAARCVLIIVSMLHHARLSISVCYCRMPNLDTNVISKSMPQLYFSAVLDMKRETVLHCGQISSRSLLTRWSPTAASTPCRCIGNQA